MTSILEVEQLDTLSSNASSTLTIGGTNTTTINLGASGKTVNIPSGATFTGSGFDFLSITSMSTQNTDISLPSGYYAYKIIGSQVTSGSGSTQYNMYTTTNNFSSTDTDLESALTYQRIESPTSTGTDGATGAIRLAHNMGADATDSLSFEIMLTDLTISSRSRGYGAFGFSLYGHNDDQHSYRYDIGGRSQTTSVVNGIRIRNETTSSTGGTILIFGGGKI